MERLLGAESIRLLAALDRPAVQGLRVNRLKLDPAELAARVPWPLTPLPWCPDGFVLEGRAVEGSGRQGERPGLHPLHAAGAYYLQDPSAMAPARLLAPRPGELVLDLAAAPGGKTTQLATLMAGSGVLVANDVDGTRVRALLSNVERWGATNVVVTQAAPARLARAWPGRFDRVLLDAPCSGEGMFRKSDEARRQWSEGLVAQCAATQSGLLDAAAELVRPGGWLVYSTCTFESAENEEAVAGLLARRPDFGLVEVSLDVGPAARSAAAGVLRLWPHLLSGDGQVAALLQRDASAGSCSTGDHATGSGQRSAGSVHRSSSAARGRSTGYARAEPAPAPALRAWRAFAEPALAAEPFGDAALLLLGERLLAVPAPLPERLPAPAGVRLVRAGVELGRIRGGRFTPAHALALAAPAGGRRLELADDDPRLARYLSGEPFPTPEPDGWARVAVAGLPLGWARVSGGSVRSLLPRGLRRATSPAAS